MRRFLDVERLSGLSLLLAAVGALAWANSPWAATYEAVWSFPVGPWFGHAVRFWINDALMAIFFLVVGLEIRRELTVGHLADRQRASLPLLAALGGMVVPAMLFWAVNAGAPTTRGWGIPMVTDIAFAAGVFGLLGRRARGSVRVVLLALAVIDDVGAIIVIALFYSAGVNLVGCVLAGVALAAALALRRFAVRSPWAYLPVGGLLWVGAYVMGVHPTIAGVTLGLLMPGDAGDRLERALQPWVAFVIMPLFALANAGVSIGANLAAPAGARLLAGVVIGLVLGKPIGILCFSWLGVRVGLARLPAGVRWADVLVLGAVAGIGFTMSLFIAGLAFPSGPALALAKLGIVCGSTLAAGVGLGLGRWLAAAQSNDQ